MSASKAFRIAKKGCSDLPPKPAVCSASASSHLKKASFALARGSARLAVSRIPPSVIFKLEDLKLKGVGVLSDGPHHVLGNALRHPGTNLQRDINFAPDEPREMADNLLA